MSRRRLTATHLAIPLLWLLLVLQLAWFASPVFPVDDAYIAFRYARNLADGEGMVFNPGQRVEGYSSFAFVLLLAAGDRVGLSPPQTATLLNLIAAGIITALLALPIGHRSPPLWLRLAAASVFVVASHTVVNGLVGLETPIAAVLLLAGVLALETSRRAVAGVCLTLFSLLRPEGVVVALAVAGTDILCEAARRSGPQLRRSLKAWTAVGAVYATYTAWRLLYFGALVPNTVHAKSGYTTLELVTRSLPYMGKFVAAWWPSLVITVLTLVLASLRRRPWPPYLPAAAGTVLALGLLIGGGDPYRGTARYLFPALPLVLVMAFRGLEEALARTPQHPRALRPAVTVVVAATVVVQAALAWDAVNWPWPVAVRETPPLARVRTGVSGLLAADKVPHTSDDPRLALGLHGLARWLMDNAEPDSLLVTSEVGVAPYYSRLTVVDSFGLVDPHIARLPGRPGRRSDPDYVFGRQPDYMAFKRRARDRGGGIMAEKALFSDPRLRGHFELVAEFPDRAYVILLFARRERAGP